MKKLLCLLLAVMLVILCFAGCSNESANNTSSQSPSNTAEQTDTFEKPENYASVVLVTINPQFRLYLDASGIVLAVEAVNADAKSIENKITFENKKVEEVVNNLVVAANDGGFVKADAAIDIKITEVADNKLDTAKILNTITASANDKLTELKITATVKASVELESDNNETSSETDLSSNTPSSSTPESSSSEKPVNTSSEKPVCKHVKTKAVSASTGKNVIDSSKLDAVNHNKVCNACKAVVATEKHTVKNGKCTVCGQSNLAEKTKYTITASVSDPNDFCAAKINSDGSLDYSLVIQASWINAKGEWLDEWHKKVPEAEMLKAIREKFVMSNSEFEKLKKQKVYNCSLSEQVYSDGYFNCTDPAAGGPGDYSHTILGYSDNKKGSFFVYYDYLLGGPDVEESERKHQYFYAVEYTYSGASNLKVAKITEDGYEHYDIKGWSPVVDSIRVKSIKKVANLPSVTTIK